MPDQQPLSPDQRFTLWLLSIFGAGFFFTIMTVVALLKDK